MSDTPKFPRPSEIRAALNRGKNFSAFRPTEAQKQARSTFWVSYKEEGTPHIGDVPLALALRLGGNTSISEWWDQEGFQDWFGNSNAFDQRGDYLAYSALDKLELILNTSADASELLKAIRMILEIGGKLSKKGPSADPEGRFLDKAIAAMNRDQLVEFIRSRGARILATQPIEAEVISLPAPEENK